ncbi:MULTISPECIES: hypothetical protein [Pectobacterium]|uniref:hypothetical protein n=1 Tax=Pectobacterium TaxID=122277 RepID=UPI0001A4272C|nr:MULTISPECIES: hypothetical protein [Pectobacterium]AZS56783.1 hypothetical protein C5E18_11935 [Pectobacterium parmentieri]KGA24911.1 hypothetical protein KS44_06255 [Pectobacterium brasiliense]KRF62848.1 hypothetical protein AO825_08285 [Pectobacterium brasiliense]MBI0431686.1 hypothetical protein [Pectobacterium parmentieri]MBN3186057.1 hypothetical protein [Pectobacterium brasiliense]
MSNEWDVIYDIQRMSWTAYEKTGLTTVGRFERFGHNGKQAAIDYAEKMAGLAKVNVNHSTDSAEEQWKRANANIQTKIKTSIL